MNITEGLIIGLSSLHKNKMRSLLTMLGIIIGISGVVGTVSVGSGAKKLILSEFERIGASNEIAVWKREWIRKGHRWERVKNNEYLEYDDALAIEANSSSIKNVHIEMGVDSHIKYGDKDRSYKLIGTLPLYQDNRNWYAAKGRFLSQDDVDSGSKVCVIGWKIWDELCEKNEHIVGNEIQINRIRFTVIGVMAEKGDNMATRGWDELMFIPLTTMQKRIMNIGNRVGSIQVQAKSFELVDQAENEVKRILSWRHRDADTAFDTWTAKKEIKNVEKVSAIIKGLLGGVASIALMVGGIGVMNIMLVSVTERTWEIGLRKAVGAKRRDILLQFLIESAVISVAGGIVGVLAGVFVGTGGAKLVSTFVAKGTNWPSVVSIQSIIIATSVSFIIGIVFGLYPANRAARLMPTEALRQK